MDLSLQISPPSITLTNEKDNYGASSELNELMSTKKVTFYSDRGSTTTTTESGTSADGSEISYNEIDTNNNINGPMLSLGFDHMSRFDGLAPFRGFNGNNNSNSSSDCYNLHHYTQFNHQPQIYGRDFKRNSRSSTSGGKRSVRAPRMRWTSTLHAHFIHAVQLLGGHESKLLVLNILYNMILFKTIILALLIVCLLIQT